MSLKETIIKKILNYPLISSTNGEIQTHLFITVGNGYKWENGELVNEFPIEDEVFTVKEAINKLFEDYKDKENSWNKCVKDKMISLTSFLDYLKKQINTILNYESILNESLDIYFNNIKDSRLLEICIYSKIYELPNKIKKDWYDAIVNYLNSVEPYIIDIDIQKEFISEIRYRLSHITIIN